MGHQPRSGLPLLALLLTTPALALATPTLELWEEDPKPLVAKAGDLVEYRIAFSNTSDESAFSLLVTTSPGSFLNRVRSALPTGAVWVSGTATPVQLVIWSNNLSGPWLNVSPAGQMEPHYARWILTTIGMRRSGYIRYCVTILGGDCQTLGAAVTASLYTTPGAPLLTASTVGYCAGRLTGVVVAAPSTIYTGYLSGEIRLTVSNSGGVDVTGTMPALQLNTGAGLAGLSGPLPAGPVTVPVGGATVFVWTVSPDFPGTLRFTVTATGNSGVGLTSTSASGSFLISSGPPPVVIDVGSRSTPASPQSGEPIRHEIFIRNAGFIGITRLSIVDTMPAPIVITGTDQPAPFTLAVASITGGTRFEWTATGTGLLPPGAVMTFTLTGYAPSMCTSDVVAPVTTATAANGFNTASVTVTGPPFTLQSPTTSIIMSFTRTPAYQTPGGAVSMIIVIANAGSATLDAVTLVDTLHPILTGVVTDQPGALGVPVVTSETTGTRFVWSTTSPGLLPPGAVFTITLTGIIGVCAGPVIMAATPWVSAASACGNAVATAEDPGFDPCGPEPLDPPTALSALGSLTGTTLSWWPSVPRASPVSGYEIWRAACASCGSVNLGTTAGTVFNDVSATAGGLTWLYRVRAVDVSGAFSLFSTTADATTPIRYALVRSMSFSTDPPMECRDFRVGTFLTNTGNVPVWTNPGESPPALLSGSQFAYPIDWYVYIPSSSPLQPGHTREVGAALLRAAAPGPITLRAFMKDALPSGTGYTLSDYDESRTIVPAVPGTPPTLSIVKTVTPQSALPGDTVTYRVVVTNVGTVTATNYDIFDSVPAAIQGVVAPNTSVLFTASTTALPGGGTGVRWIPYPSLAINPGFSLTFTITGFVALATSSGTVWNTAQVFAGSPDNCREEFPGAPAPLLIREPPPSVNLTILRTPPTPMPGDLMRYTLVVRNAGAGTITALTVIQTVPPELTGATTSQPTAYSSPIIASTASGTRFVWSASGALLLRPASVFTFTITGLAQSFCTAATLSSTVLVQAGNPMGATESMAAAPLFALAPPSTGVAISLLRSPASPVSSGPISYRLVVVNSGAATLTTLTIVDTLHPLVTVTGSNQPAVLGAPTVTGGVSGTRYVWTAAGPGLLPPGQALTVTITGFLGACTGPVTVGATPWVTGSSTCNAAAATFADPGFILCGTMPPGPPGALTVRGPAGDVRIGWSAAPPGTYTVSAYEVWRATCASCGPALLGSVPDPATTFTDGSVTTGGWARFYTVRAVDTAALAGSFAGPVSVILGPPTCSTCVTPSIAAAFAQAVGGVNGYVQPALGERAAITFRPSGAGLVTVRIYTLAGRLVRELTLAGSAGRTDTIFWDASDASGNPVPPGVYPLIVEGPGIRLRAKFGVLR